MFLALFFVVFWFIMRGAAFVRPSALHRGYVLMWVFSMSWCILVAITVFEDRFHIAAGYAFVFFHGAAFLALFISLCELFALPKLQTYAQDRREDGEGVISPFPTAPQPESLISPSPGEAPSITAGETQQDDDNEEEAEAPTETTPLVGKSAADPERTTFATGYRQAGSILSDSQNPEPKKSPVFPVNKAGLEISQVGRGCCSF